MTRREAIMALNFAGDIGNVRFGNLIARFETPEAISSASEESLARVSGINVEIATKIKSVSQRRVLQELEDATKLGISICTIDDPDYPALLKEIPGAPLVLYVKGSLSPLDEQAIAIVGSRQASFYGLTSAGIFAEALAARGVTVVSGMARGIDTAAHRGAIKAGGRTLAVMGSGFRHVYPPENKELADDISRHGAVISEFPLDVEPFKNNFPRRNRLISGLSLGVLVAEAARNSGALITADFALEQGREVFALPGKIDASTSFGANELIKQGAKLVTSVDDIIEEFGVPATRPAAAYTRNPSVNEEEEEVYRFVSEEPVTLEHIVTQSGVALAKASKLLLQLQLKKRVRQLAGTYYVKG